MYYEKLFFTVNLNLVNYLTIECGFRIVKVKRDLKTNSGIVFFYFEESASLLEAVDKYKSEHPVSPAEEALARLGSIENGVWRSPGSVE